MSIPLEDLYNDVIGKAQRGLGIDDDALASRTGLTAARIGEIKHGAVDEESLLKIATALQLHGPSLVTMARGEWTPAPVNLDGLGQFNTTWHDMTVNAYLLWDPASREAAAFDTGATAVPMVEAIQARGLSLKAIFLTHTHPDHVADIGSLVAAGGGSVPVFVNGQEPHNGAQAFSIEDQPVWNVGSLRIEPRSTWGHSRGGTSYVVQGLARTVVVVGDALFASSMGGGMVSYPDALATNRASLFTLPSDCIVCPGHGPLTTIGEEKAHNPFYPEFKTSA